MPIPTQFNGLPQRKRFLIFSPLSFHNRTSNSRYIHFKSVNMGLGIDAITALLLSLSCAVVDAAKENFDRSKPHVNIGKITSGNTATVLDATGFEVVGGISMTNMMFMRSNEAPSTTLLRSERKQFLNNFVNLTLQRKYSDDDDNARRTDKKRDPLDDGYDYSADSFFDIFYDFVNNSDGSCNTDDGLQNIEKMQNHYWNVMLELEVPRREKVDQFEYLCYPQKWEMTTDDLGLVDSEVVKCACTHC